MALTLAMGLLFCSCSDNDEPNPFRGNVEEIDGKIFTTFHLRDSGSAHWEMNEEVSFLLVNPGEQLSFEFKGSIMYSSADKHKVLTCRVAIGDTAIPDGIYFVSLQGENVPDIGVRKVRFENSIGTEDESGGVDYKDMEGSGTETDPYLVSSPGDFLVMLSYLLDDPTHAYGRYFKQTRPIELPRRSQVIDGRMWVAASFSGNYDGGGYRLHNLVYQGASDPGSDSGIGLFKDIYSATISNVTVSGALISNVCSDVGIIAGRASGNCNIENVTVDGNIIANGSNLGGIIGYSKGEMIMNNIKVNSLTISTDPTSGACVGMLTGYHEDGNLTIDGVTTSDHIFSLAGSNNVGGLVGKVYGHGKTVSISNVLIQHSVDNESSTVKIIHGATNVGGLVGHLSEIGILRLVNNQVKAPVSGDSNVGGLAGYCSLPSNVSVDRCQLTSVVSGGESVGGFFGNVNMGSHGVMEFTGADNGSRLVVKSSASAEVTGRMNVGGLIGYIDGKSGKINMISRVEIALNVSGLDRIGGAIGSAKNIEVALADNLNFSSSTMKVTATDKCAGGVMGYGSSVTISGGMHLDPENEIPAASQITLTFCGVVTGSTEAGGIIGVLAGGTVKGMGTAAKATASTSTAGGIAGKATGTITECAFDGTLGCPVSQGGIVGYCTNDNLSISKCINYASLTNANNLGGVMGYYESSGEKTRDFNTLHIARCYNLGDITGGLDAAGILAHAQYPESQSHDGVKDVWIEKCGNAGKIIGNDNSGKNCAGGVAGTLNCLVVYVTGCANNGAVGSTGVQKAVGGVVGRAGCENGLVVSVEECANSGTVTSDAHSVKIGGVVGHLENSLALGDASHIKNCANYGSIPGDQKDDTGGIVGYVARFTDTSDNYNEGIVKHGNAIIGTHNTGTTFSHSNNYFIAGSGASWPSSTEVSPENKFKESSYKGLDFSNVWVMDMKHGPVLRNCPFQLI